MSKDANNMTFFEHLDCLRPGLIRTVIAFAVAALAAFLAKEYIMDVVMGPKSPSFPTNAALAALADRTGSDALRINSGDITFVNTSMAGQFNMHIMVAFYAAMIFTLPWALVELWRFVKPALNSDEVHNGRRFMLWATLCMAAGAAFGYFVLAPLSVNFLSGYTVSDQIHNFIDARSYISLVMNLSLVCAVVFELPLLVYFLARLGVLRASFMRRYRRHAIVLLAMASAIITPPDVFSMILVIIPLYLLYEVSIRIAERNQRRSAA